MLSQGIFNSFEGKGKSLQEELRFKIGEQYELNEFHLKSIKSTFNKGIEYENYEYIKKDFETLFGVEFSSNLILQYNGEILCGIIFEFNRKHFENLITKLESNLNLEVNTISKKILLGQTICIYSFQEISLTLSIQDVIRLRVFKILGQT